MFVVATLSLHNKRIQFVVEAEGHTRLEFLDADGQVSAPALAQRPVFTPPLMDFPPGRVSQR